MSEIMQPFDPPAGGLRVLKQRIQRRARLQRSVLTLSLVAFLLIPVLPTSHSKVALDHPVMRLTQPPQPARFQGSKAVVGQYDYDAVQVYWVVVSDDNQAP